MQILVVADNPRITAQVMTALIGGDDVSYQQVRTPQRALALLDEGRSFDIVIGDCDTAPTGGFFLAREIKARVKMGQDVPPVLLLVAREQDNYLARWSETDAWVLKPVDPFDLAAAVQALVEHRPVPKLPGVWEGGETAALDERAAPGTLTASGGERFVERTDDDDAGSIRQQR